jgi:hypothetical protein
MRANHVPHSSTTPASQEIATSGDDALCNERSNLDLNESFRPNRSLLADEVRFISFCTVIWNTLQVKNIACFRQR